MKYRSWCQLQRQQQYCKINRLTLLTVNGNFPNSWRAPLKFHKEIKSEKDIQRKFSVDAHHGIGRPF
jgi:hypothetical protein